MNGFESASSTSDKTREYISPRHRLFINLINLIASRPFAMSGKIDDEVDDD
jgi:hypothetical protein